MNSAMKRLNGLALLVVAVLLGGPGLWAAKVGEPAPEFTATDSAGKVHKLSDYKGKFVVLEWHNRECPYTHKHYASGNMQNLQREWTAKGVVWFTVISSAPGKQGYMTPAEENAYVEKMKAMPTAVLLDPTGQLGHLYGAKTTPQILIINPAGVLIYDGAIDSKPTAEVEDIASATNYVNLALEEAMAGEAVKTPVTRPYGCSVKYAQ